MSITTLRKIVFVAKSATARCNGELLWDLNSPPTPPSNKSGGNGRGCEYGTPIGTSNERGGPFGVALFSYIYLPISMAVTNSGKVSPIK